MGRAREAKNYWQVVELFLKFIVTDYVNYIFFCDTDICTEDAVIHFKVKTSKDVSCMAFSYELHLNNKFCKYASKLKLTRK